MQRGTLGSLSMVTGDDHDAELCTPFLQLFNVMNASENLCSVREGPTYIKHMLLANNIHVKTEAMNCKACRYVEEWWIYAFRSVIHD